MSNDPLDQAFSRHVRSIGIASSEQLQSAREAQLKAAQDGAPLSISEALVRNGVITPSQKLSLEQKVKELQAGLQQLGPYKIVKKIGEGGMGAVYLATDPASSRNVAIKVLPRQFGENPVFVKRFEREAAAALRLRHPNIVGAYSAGEEQGYRYYAMEHCEGESLDALLRRGELLPVARTLQIAVHAARGLQYVHAEGVIHRDIKPSNLIIAKSGAAKILDLGLAKPLDDLERTMLTATGMVLGTPHYLSPEQAQASKSIDGRSDIYSLGATLYHLLTGRTPFEGRTMLEILSKHLHTQLPDPRDLRAEIPDGVVQVLQRMMAKRPEDRYRDCGELLVDLEEALAGREPKTLILPPSHTLIARRAGAPKRRKAFLIGAAAVVVALGLGALLWPREVPPVAQLWQPDAVPKPPAAPTPDEQLRSVMSQLLELNPEFDRKETHRIEGGALLDFTISAVGVSRISPISELRALVTLDVSGRGEEAFGSIHSLDPLKGLKLRSLLAHHNPFSDLSPLAGMPLETLDLTRTGVTDLSPLHGMPLRALTIGATEIQDLSPLRGLPLRALSMRGLRVADLSPLHELPLETLEAPLDPANDGAWLSRIPTLQRVNGMPVAQFLKKNEFIELLPLIDPVKDRGQGDWTKRGAELVTDRSGNGWIAIPYSPPAEYDFLVEFTRQTGTCDTGVFFVREGTTSYLALGNWGNSRGGIGTIQGQTADTNVTGRPHRLQDLHRYRLLLQVRRESVTALLDGVEFTRWTPKMGALGPWSDMLRGGGILGLGNCETTTTFHRAALRAVTGQGRAIREPAAPDEAFLRSLAGLSAAEQLPRVLDKLAELNPQFLTASARPRIGNNAVLELAFSNSVLTELWPLRGLTSLRVLDLQNRDFGALESLEGLKGLKLRDLNIRGTRVSDLSPLADMPLETLDCRETAVRDLSPLRNLPLRVVDYRGSPSVDLLSVKDIRSLHTINGIPADELLRLAAMWKPWFDGKSLAGLKPNPGWKLDDGALVNAAPDVGEAQSINEMVDGILRIRFEAQGLDSAHFRVRQGAAGGYDVRFGKPELKALEGAPHVLVFECRGDRVTATLDDKPLPLSDVKPSARGGLRFNGAKGTLRVLAIDYREIP